MICELDQLIVRSAVDHSTRRALLDDPVGHLRQCGLSIPDGVTVRFVESTPIEFILPVAALRESSGNVDGLDEDALSHVSGGFTPTALAASAVILTGIAANQLVEWQDRINQRR